MKIHLKIFQKVFLKVFPKGEDVSIFRTGPTNKISLFDLSNVGCVPNSALQLEAYAETVKIGKNVKQHHTSSNTSC